MHKYVYPPGFISENEAIQIIYECIYPNDSKSDAYKRIRQRIRKAQLDGDLPEFSPLKVDPDIFFNWAIKSKGWGAVENILGLPVSTVVMVTGVGLESKGEVGEAYAIIDPEGDSTKIQMENQDLHKALTIKQVELEQAQLEIEAIKLKDKLHKKRLSEAGKKGGRGKGW